jgi:hypothetical protein
MDAHEPAERWTYPKSFVAGPFQEEPHKLEICRRSPEGDVGLGRSLPTTPAATIPYISAPPFVSFTVGALSLPPGGLPLLPCRWMIPRIHRGGSGRWRVVASPSSLQRCPRHPLRRRGSIGEAADGGVWWLPRPPSGDGASLPQQRRLPRLPSSGAFHGTRRWQPMAAAPLPLPVVAVTPVGSFLD